MEMLISRTSYVVRYCNKSSSRRFIFVEKVRNQMFIGVKITCAKRKALGPVQTLFGLPF